MTRRWSRVSDEASPRRSSSCGAAHSPALVRSNCGAPERRRCEHPGSGEACTKACGTRRALWYGRMRKTRATLSQALILHGKCTLARCRDSRVSFGIVPGEGLVGLDHRQGCAAAAAATARRPAGRAAWQLANAGLPAPRRDDHLHPPVRCWAGLAQHPQE